MDLISIESLNLYHNKNNSSMKGVVTYLLLIILIGYTHSLQAQNNIIPAPVSIQNTEATFQLNSEVSLDVATKDENVQKIGVQFAAHLKSLGCNVQVRSVANPTTTNRVIKFSLKSTPNPELTDEGYMLDVSATSVSLTANKPAGIFNGVQTLLQLIPDTEGAGSGTMTIKGCTIKDYPRFKWRGLMLDVSRHFFTKEEVMQYIDVMSRYKFNVFHWHLTDDNGWRLEIKSLPKLTEVGAWRVQRYGRFGNREAPKEGEPTTYGGFYTQDDVKEIIQYASERNITIVPEIDVPGHSMAALAAYPELSTLKEPKMVNPGSRFSEWYGNGKFKMLVENTLNPSDEKVYEFLEKVFTEVAALFPGPYIHVGGDECYHGYWEDDANCKALMKKNNLKDGRELQSYFMKRVEKIVEKKGKKMIGWDEILEGGLAPGAAVMSWRGMEGGIQAAKLGHDVVMSPTTFAYLDYTQGDPTIEIPIYSSLSLKKAYAFEPVPEGVDQKFILGGQANLWTEQIPTLRHALYMTYPRAFATAESVWSPKGKKDWNDFARRVEDHFHQFDAADLSICKALFDPIVEAKMVDGKLMCVLSSDVEGLNLYYTIDSTFPDKHTPKYKAPFEVPNGDVTLKVVAYRDGDPIGRMLSIPRDDLLKRAGK
jgi:hexosaminidase